MQITQKKLVSQLHQMQTKVQYMQLQYSAAPHLTHQYYGGWEYYEEQNNFSDEKDVVLTFE